MLVEKTRPADVVERVSGSSGSLGKDDESDALRNEQAENAEDLSDDREGRSLETSFKHLWSDYSVDWKDTRRYHADSSAAPHRRLCMSRMTLLGLVLQNYT